MHCSMLFCLFRSLCTTGRINYMVVVGGLQGTLKKDREKATA